MKKVLIVLLSVIISHSLSAQITLKECIEKGLGNKTNIKIAKTDQVLENLKSIEAKGKYLPEISIAYDFRYNPIIGTQVIPVGQLSSNPTDETRPIQFGTNWEQNAGLTVYQPILDLILKNRFKESKLNESLSGIDLEKAETDLKFEIVKSYIQVLTLNYQIEEAISDTVRSHVSYTILKSKFNEGKVLKTELNTSLVNHNNNLFNYKNSVASLFNEKIYLHYLTNIELEELLDGEFSSVPQDLFDAPGQETDLQIESTPEFRELMLRQQLIAQQIKTEKNKNAPKLGFKGFVGANQFSQEFRPFEGSSWFGSSYVGLFLDLPLFTPNKSVNGSKQLQNQIYAIDFEKEELMLDKNKEFMQIQVEIGKLNDELKFKKENLSLLEENVTLFQQRIENGQVESSELNLQEADLQKLKEQINQINERLNKAKAERLFISGELSNRLNML